MKLSELSPAAGSVREAYRKGLNLTHRQKNANQSHN